MTLKPEYHLTANILINMSDNGTNICIMILCGLPAAGKTCVTRDLLDDHLNRDISDSSENTQFRQGLLQYIIVEYDQLLPVDVEKDLMENRQGLHNQAQEIPSPWKQYRSDIYTCIDALICHLMKEMTSNNLSSIEKPETICSALWERFQCIVIGQLRERIDALTKICLVIDDNMYYSSMRYMFYQLARKYTVGYCQLFLTCDVNEALKRNSSRPCPVPDDVIIAMETKFEVPDTNNTWEKLSLSSSVDNITREHVEQLVEEALNAPVQPVPEIDEEAVTQSRQTCSANFLHQTDQILRKLVSQEISSAKNKTKSAMKEFSSTIQLRRKKILEGLKSSKITVPSNVLDSVIDSSKDENSPVYVFIKNLFDFHHDIK